MPATKKPAAVRNRVSAPGGSGNAPRRWFEVTNAAAGGVPQIKLRGYIGAPKTYVDYWYGGTVEDPDAAGTLGEFEEELDALGDVANLELLIFSQGGDWSTGVGIHNLLIRHPANKVAIIDGLCASAATYPAMACHEIRIPSNASMLVHEAEGCECGNAADLRAYADDLDGISNNIAELYAARTGKPVNEIRALMAEDRYLFGKECVDLGLADTLVEPLANLASRAGSLQPTNRASLLHAPAEVLALFDMRAVSNLTKPTNHPSMKLRTPLLTVAADTTTGGGATVTPPVNTVPPVTPPVVTPPAQVVTPPAQVVTPPAAVPTLTLDAIRNAMKEEVQPLRTEIETLRTENGTLRTEVENLRTADATGVRAAAGVGTAPVQNLVTTPTEPEKPKFKDPANPTPEEAMRFINYGRTRTKPNLPVK